MAKKTKVINGWCYEDECIPSLTDMLEDNPVGNILFLKKGDAALDIPLKRIKLTVTIEDYEPKRSTKTNAKQ